MESFTINEYIHIQPFHIKYYFLQHGKSWKHNSRILCSIAGEIQNVLSTTGHPIDNSMIPSSFQRLGTEYNKNGLQWFCFFKASLKIKISKIEKKLKFFIWDLGKGGTSRLKSIGVRYSSMGTAWWKAVLLIFKLGCTCKNSKFPHTLTHWKKIWHFSIFLRLRTKEIKKSLTRFCSLKPPYR